MHVRETEPVARANSWSRQVAQSGAQQRHPQITNGLTQRQPLSYAITRRAKQSLCRAHASAIQRVAARTPSGAAHNLLQLQRAYGNRFVQRVVQLANETEGETQVSTEIEQAVNSARSGGQAMDSGTRAQMGTAFGTDFGGVRVHTGAQADTLNTSLSARAFTTGQDIFFREGEYRPGSSSGRELLAHELTHVVQQTGGGGLQTKMTLGQPGDRYEQEADAVARAVMQQEQMDSQATADQGPIRRQIEEEEEEELQTKAADVNLQRQPEEEEEGFLP